MQNPREIVETAVKMEIDGITFYREAAEKTPNPLGKRMFLSLSRDEERHLDVLKRMLEDLHFSAIETYFQGSPKERVKTIFKQARGELAKQVAAEPGELEVLKMGLSIEDKSVTFYQKALSNAEGPLRSLLERLVREEREHYAILENTYAVLESSKDWYLWEEKGLLDGGEL